MVQHTQLWNVYQNDVILQRKQRYIDKYKTDVEVSLDLPLITKFSYCFNLPIHKIGEANFTNEE